MEFFGVQNSSTNTVLTASQEAVTSTPWSERELASRSLWASLGSLATINLNVVKLSLNRKVFHGCLPVWRANGLGSLVTSDPG